MTSTYRPLTAPETRAWLKGANFGAVVAGAYLRANVPGFENAANDLYLRITA